MGHDVRCHAEHDVGCHLFCWLRKYSNLQVKKIFRFRLQICRLRKYSDFALSDVGRVGWDVMWDVGWDVMWDVGWDVMWDVRWDIMWDILLVGVSVHFCWLRKYSNLQVKKIFKF